MKHFEPYEFVMGGKEVYDKMDPEFLAKLDMLRELCGFGLVLTSTYRSPEYNASIGGASQSKHMEGIAADISCQDSITRRTIVKKALSLDLTVGVAKTFIHIDNRPDPIMFTY